MISTYSLNKSDSCKKHVRILNATQLFLIATNFILSFVCAAIIILGRNATNAGCVIYLPCPIQLNK
jgi:hypothetical protein